MNKEKLQSEIDQLNKTWNSGLSIKEKDGTIMLYKEGVTGYIVRGTADQLNFFLIGLRSQAQEYHLEWEKSHAALCGAKRPY